MRFGSVSSSKRARPFFRLFHPSPLVAAAISQVLLVALVSLVLADEIVTVVLKSGEKHEKVAYRLRSEFNVVEIQSGNTLINVSYSDIEAIYDAGGSNIAPRLLGTRYRPNAQGSPPAADSLAHPPPAPAEGGAVVGGVSALPGQPWRVVFALAGGGDIPFGDYYDGTKGGIGFGGAIHVALTRELALLGSLTMLGVGFDESFGLVSFDPQLQIVSQHHDLDALRALVGVEYHKSVGGRAARWGFWYLHYSLGAIRHDLKGEAILYDSGSGQSYQATLDDQDTRFTMSNGGGLIYGLSNRIGIHGSADLDLVWTKVYSSGGTSAAIKGFVFGVHAGLALRL